MTHTTYTPSKSAKYRNKGQKIVSSYKKKGDSIARAVESLGLWKDCC